jgi:Cu+-exporting ATPase
MSIMVATGKAATQGILFRDAAAIERLREVDTLIVDKTGTLTEGKPSFERAVAAPEHRPRRTEILRWPPVSTRAANIPWPTPSCRRLPGTQGLALDKAGASSNRRAASACAASVAGRRVVLGNTVLMTQEGIDVAVLGNAAEALRQEGASVMYLAADGRLQGLLAVSDPVKQSTPDALTALRQAGMRVIMATGDGETTARAVGKRLGIDEVHGEVKPADKLALVERLQREGRVVAMAGDGINDAPALAKADVGIAMGTGTDVAMNSAQVTLVKGDLRGIARARELSMATVANMRQNLMFAFLYNALGVPIAAGILYPVFGLVLSPIIAAAAMSLSSVSVVGNALRLRQTS